MNPTQLTYEQKLEALSFKYYQGQKWNPKAGDFYTSSRNDLDLYQIVSIENGVVETKYCDPERGTGTEKWDKSDFLKGFGEHRVYVPNFILE